MTPEQQHREAPYSSSPERPPWLEEAADPTYWDVALGSYGDGYLEWVTSRYFWHPHDERTIADTRTLWDKHRRYDDPLIVELNQQLDDDRTSDAGGEDTAVA